MWERQGTYQNRGEWVTLLLAVRERALYGGNSYKIPKQDTGSNYGTANRPICETQAWKKTNE